MTPYFSDREYGPKPMVNETIGSVVWKAIWSLIEARISDASLAQKFPSMCQDSDVITGTNWESILNTIRAEIGNLADDDTEAQPDVANWWPSPDNLPNTPAILDLIEFVAGHVAKPIRREWDPYWKHHHYLEFDKERGQREFTEDINRIFSRNSLVYGLNNKGIVERTHPEPMAALLARTRFRTGDPSLDNYLNNAVERFLSPKPEASQESLEKLWDAFERLKTIECSDKKQGAQKLIDSATAKDGPIFRKTIESEFKEMTNAGNNLRIRHSETDRESLGNKGEKDYLFMRLFSLIWFTLQRTERLS